MGRLILFCPVCKNRSKILPAAVHEIARAVDDLHAGLSYTWVCDPCMDLVAIKGMARFN